MERSIDRDRGRGWEKRGIGGGMGWGRGRKKGKEGKRRGKRRKKRKREREREGGRERMAYCEVDYRRSENQFFTHFVRRRYRRRMKIKKTPIDATEI